MLTSDWTDDDIESLDVICADLGGQALDLLSVMYAESGCSTKALNDNPKTRRAKDGGLETVPVDERYNAVGLIQFMPFILAGLGYHPEFGNRDRVEAFRKLTVAQQLPYVRRYFQPHAGKLTNEVAWYMATFLPAYIAHADEPEYVLAVKGAKGFSGAVYTANAGFDADGDHRIVVRELGVAIARNCVGARWDEFVARFAGQTIPVIPPPTLPPPREADLGTWRGAQAALKALGFYDGSADGIWGPLSKSALLAFQEGHTLTPDGIYGPLTRAALQREYTVWLAAPLAALP